MTLTGMKIFAITFCLLSMFLDHYISVPVEESPTYIYFHLGTSASTANVPYMELAVFVILFSLVLLLQCRLEYDNYRRNDHSDSWFLKLKLCFSKNVTRPTYPEHDDNNIDESSHGYKMHIVRVLCIFTAVCFIIVLLLYIAPSPNLYLCARVF